MESVEKNWQNISWQNLWCIRIKETLTSTQVRIKFKKKTKNRLPVKHRSVWISLHYIRSQNGRSDNWWILMAEGFDPKCLHPSQLPFMCVTMETYSQIHNNTKMYFSWKKIIWRDTPTDSKINPLKESRIDKQQITHIAIFCFYHQSAYYWRRNIWCSRKNIR